MTPADHINLAKAMLAYSGAFLIFVFALGSAASFMRDHLRETKQ